VPVTTPPTFKPAFFSIPLGAAGTVLTSNGTNAAPTFQAGGGGGGGGQLATAVLTAGENDNLNPGSGWPTGYGRLDLNAAAGVANLTGLLAGTDGQQVIIRNLPGSGNNITLNNQNAGSLAANRFQGLNLSSPNADVILAPGSAILLMYYGGSLNYWVMFA
jgi:hypothetical protein